MHKMKLSLREKKTNQGGFFGVRSIGQKVSICRGLFFEELTEQEPRGLRGRRRRRVR